MQARRGTGAEGGCGAPIAPSNGSLEATHTHTHTHTHTKQVQWLSLDKVGPKMAANILLALSDSLKLPMAVALAGFGVP